MAFQYRFVLGRLGSLGFLRLPLHREYIFMISLITLVIESRIWQDYPESLVMLCLFSQYHIEFRCPHHVRFWFRISKQIVLIWNGKRFPPTMWFLPSRCTEAAPNESRPSAWLHQSGSGHWWTDPSLTLVWELGKRNPPPTGPLGWTGSARFRQVGIPSLGIFFEAVAVANSSVQYYFRLPMKIDSGQ